MCGLFQLSVLEVIVHKYTNHEMETDEVSSRRKNIQCNSIQSTPLRIKELMRNHDDWIIALDHKSVARGHSVYSRSFCRHFALRFA